MSEYTCTWINEWLTGDIGNIGRYNVNYSNTKIVQELN